MPAGLIRNDGMAGDNGHGADDRLGTSAPDDVNDRAADAGLINSQVSVRKWRLVEQVDYAITNLGVGRAERKPLQMTHGEKLFRWVGSEGPLQDRQGLVLAVLAQVQAREVADFAHVSPPNKVQIRAPPYPLSTPGCRRIGKPRRPRLNQKTPPSSATRPGRDCLCPQVPLLSSGCSPGPRRTRRSLPPCKSASFAPPSPNRARRARPGRETVSDGRRRLY